MAGLPADLVGILDQRACGVPDALGLWHQRLVASSANVAPFRVATKGRLLSTTRRGDLRSLAERLDPVGAAVLVVGVTNMTTLFNSVSNLFDFSISRRQFIRT